MRILAISGKRGAGKDTLADFLVWNGQVLFGGPVTKRGLADPIKGIIRDMLGGDPAVLWGTNEQKEQVIRGARMTYRAAMREIGAALARIKPLVFVDALMRHVDPMGVTIINDMRLLNEAQALKRVGVKIVRLTRAENPDDTHVTETALDAWDGFDAVINNCNTTAAYTQQQMVKLLHSWGWLREDD